MISHITKRLMTHFPQWMQIRKDQESVGAQFLNTFGIELEEIEKLLDEQLNNQYVGTANLGQIDILYKSIIDSGIQESDTIILTGDGYTIEIIDGLRAFYESEDTHIAILDHDQDLVYTKQEYNTLVVNINGDASTIPQILHHVWNSFDEFGLLLNTPRLHGETNEEYKRRILHVFTNPGSATYLGLQNYVGRQLGIAPHHVKLDTMKPAFVGTLLKPDGSASTQLKDIVRRIGEAAPVTWRHASWDQVYWMTVEPNMLGLDFLPNIWDVPMDKWDNLDFQSGIGDGRDLKVELPRAEKDEQAFDYFVGVHGATTEQEMLYIPHSFMYEIQATGYIPENISPPETYHYEIAAAEIIPLIFTVRAYKEYMQHLRLNYDGGMEYTLEDGLEMIPGNQITSTDSDQVRIRATLRTTNSEVTPALSNLQLHWYNTSDVLQTTEFNINDDWNNNDEIATTGITIANNQIRLATTEFDESVDTTAEWTEAEVESINIKIIDNTITLLGVSSE